MPLRDHFRSPLAQERPWESFHTTWASALADHLNRDVLPSGYIALEQVHAGAAVEIDVATFSGEKPAEGGGGTATLAKTVWLPAIAPLVLPGEFPPTCTVEIVTTEGGRSLAAAIELVSPGNKDRPGKRKLFAAKCATYLSRGIGLIIIDVVTSRQANLHNDLVELMGLGQGFGMAGGPSLYAAAYRPLKLPDGGRVDAWPFLLAVGQPLPILPLSLSAEHCLALDLEAAYADACERRRLDEVQG